MKGMFFVEKTLKELNERQKQEEDELKKIITIRDLKSKRLAAQGDYIGAIKELEEILDGCPENELKNITEKIKTLEVEYKAKIRHKQNELKDFQKREKEEENLKNSLFWDEIFKYENFIRDGDIYKAYLHLIKMKKEFPGLPELESRLRETKDWLDYEKIEQKEKRKLENKKKEEAFSIFKKAEEAFLRKQYEECTQLLRLIIGAGHHYSSEATKLLNELEENERRKQVQAEEEKKKKEKEKKDDLILKQKIYEADFEKALINEDVELARRVLDAVKNLDSIETEFLGRLKVMEERLKQAVKEKQHREKIKNDKFYENFKRGIELFESQNYYDAFAYFKIACRIEPLDEEANDFKQKTLDKINEIENLKALKEKNNNEFEEKFVDFKIKLVSFIEAGAFNKAFEECHRMSQRYPGQPSIIHEMEKVQAQFKKFKEEEERKNIKIEEIKKIKDEELFQQQIAKGKVRIRQNDFDGALEIFYQALHIDSQNSQLEKLIDEVEVKKKKWEQKIKDDEAVLFNKKRSIRKLILEADKLCRMKDLQKGIELYEKVLAIEPENIEVQSKLRNAEIKLIEEAEKIELEKKKNQEQIREWKLKIRSCINEGDSGQAILICDKILLDDPENKGIKKIREQLLSEKLKNEESYSKKAAEEKESLLILEEKKNYEKNKLLSQIKDIYDNGLKFIRNEEYERGIEEWRKIRIINPSYSQIDDEIRKVRMKIKEKEIVRLQNEEINKQNEIQVNALYIEGRKYLREKKYFRAIEVFEKALCISRKDQLIFNELEKAEKLFEEHNKEIEAERNLFLQSKKEINELIFKASRLFNQEKYRDALILLEQAYALDPQNIEIKNGIINAESKIRHY